MDNIQQVLKKARDEGKIDSALLPWEGPATSDGETGQADKARPQLARSGHGLDIPQAFLEDFERIAANVKMEAAAAGHKVVGFASVQHQEGNTTLLAILATLLAQQGSRVLLVDAQLRHPSLHRTFGLAQRPGLGELLAGETTFEQAARLVSDLPLYVVPATTMQVHNGLPEELADFLQAQHAHFDWLLLDLPPVLPSAETFAFGKICDGVVLVVGANQTRREAVESAASQLAQARVNLIGSVLNRRKYYLPEGVYRRV